VGIIDKGVCHPGEGGQRGETGTWVCLEILPLDRRMSQSRRLTKDLVRTPMHPTSPILLHHNRHQLLVVVHGNGWPKVVQPPRIMQCPVWGLYWDGIGCGGGVSKRVDFRSGITGLFTTILTHFSDHSSSISLSDRYVPKNLALARGESVEEKTTRTTLPKNLTHVILTVCAKNKSIRIVEGV